MGLYDKLEVAPNFGPGWHGQLISLDGAEAKPFGEEDVKSVLYEGHTPGGWDGQQVAVLLLNDGRYVAYETYWDVTGDGFNEDAYGGDADVYFGKDLNNLILTALTDAGRRLCGIPEGGLQ